jgi:hypothetical protein
MFRTHVKSHPKKQFQANSQIFPARKPKNQGIPGEQVLLMQFIEQLKCIFCAYQCNITSQHLITYESMIIIHRLDCRSS